ncbi:MAG TPA: CopG family transcriptional regulator [Solirubrobacterales bacterium]|nr:ribbon-helix-helix domain-containing protein [Solirubrobacterales bacterium]HMU26182.1 CopG family transcriptional regulator [Solirubrobacterales bacterium]HMX70293.1 CopG family transcriptional regulator [Solirubrobacterales bacterium]HMY25806.1 CopG family transcriptional regulator [Solirubrobacterales bacterium]HNA23660.1 CopG family transcriptional regulator [Solirubrobacterales bacterium]
MGRTQVYLGSEELEMLDRAAADTGATRSELIRRAVRRSYGRGHSDPLRIVLETAGAWKSEGSGSDFVDEVRPGGLDERLASFGIE